MAKRQPVFMRDQVRGRAKSIRRGRPGRRATELGAEQKFVVFLLVLTVLSLLASAQA